MRCSGGPDCIEMLSKGPYKSPCRMNSRTSRNSPKGQRMVASTGTEKSKPTSGNKVSKPLMEKKRRARINQCLDELKTLLESFYSNNIRKRKLEKADILELTVKHLRSLQKLQSCTVGNSDFSDFQIGFRSCLANFNQYLVMADHMSGSERWMLMQLSNKLSRRESASSTTDSSSLQSHSRKEARELLPRAVETKEETGKCESIKPLDTPPATFSQAKDIYQCQSGASRTSLTTATAQSPKGEVDCLDVANTQQRMWRPW